jgi:pimeloyl-ACP methyl ester carboxylesterase
VCARLMDHLGWRTAHLVGHSYGALIALQLAMDAPARARSLVLLEPALRGVPSSAQVVASLSPVVGAYGRGDRAAAVDLFLQTVCGAGYRDTLERVVPGAFGTAVEHADVFFQVEMPVVQQWSFGPAEAASVAQPVLNVAGARTAPRFVEGADLLQGSFPMAERFTLPEAGHLLMVENAKALADALEGFFARHAIG